MGDAAHNGTTVRARRDREQRCGLWRVARSSRCHSTARPGRSGGACQPGACPSARPLCPSQARAPRDFATQGRAQFCEERLVGLGRIGVVVLRARDPAAALQVAQDAAMERGGEFDDVLVRQWGSLVEDRPRERTGAGVDAVEDEDVEMQIEIERAAGSPSQQPAGLSRCASSARAPGLTPCATTTAPERPLRTPALAARSRIPSSSARRARGCAALRNTGDQAAVPAQDRIERHDGRDPVQKLASELLSLGGQTTPLFVSQAQPPAAQPFLEDTVLFGSCGPAVRWDTTAPAWTRTVTHVPGHECYPCTRSGPGMSHRVEEGYPPLLKNQVHLQVQLHCPRLITSRAMTRRWISLVPS